MITRFFDCLFDNPQFGAAGSIGSFVVGMIPEISSQTMNYVTFSLQCLAFITSIIVGIATLYTLHLKWKEKRKSKNIK